MTTTIKGDPRSFIMGEAPMLRRCFKALIIGAGIALSAQSASAITLNKNVTIDAGGHRTRQEHVNYCRNTRRGCFLDIGPTLPRHPDAANHCAIAFDQCMNQ